MQFRPVFPGGARIPTFQNVHGQRLPCQHFQRGDPSNLALLDANDDGGIDISDPVYLLQYLFQGGAPPVHGTSCIAIPRCPDTEAICGQ